MTTTYRYIVEYVTASEKFHRITVEAIDAIDAKHLAEALEGEVILTARARRVRGAPATKITTTASTIRDPLEDPDSVYEAQGHPF